MTEENGSAEEYWDARYGQSEQMWSGNPNVALVREVADLVPGSALDVGCGEGGDVIWLAQQGWLVTATDISQTALERAARHAAAAEVADRVDWQRLDLAVSFPAGVFDLVSAQFLHSRGDMPREEILRAAASAVAPGGTLLIVGHLGFPSWEDHDHDHDVSFPTPAEVLDALDLADQRWHVARCEEHERSETDPDGNATTRTDSIVKVRRLGA